MLGKGIVRTNHVATPQVLAFLKDYIVFAEKDEELNTPKPSVGRLCPARQPSSWGTI